MRMQRGVTWEISRSSCVCLVFGIIFLGQGCEHDEGASFFAFCAGQLGVDRNTAIRALKKNGGDLVDAMLNIG